MQAKLPYEGLAPTLLALRHQAAESVPFLAQWLPRHGAKQNATPLGRLFSILRQSIRYTEEDGELIMTAQTLLSPTLNVNGGAGMGDCDDFTVLALASAYAQGYRDLDLVIAGNYADAPSHVYCRIEGVIFDLTRDKIGQTRKYRFVQSLPFRLFS